MPLKLRAPEGSLGRDERGQRGGRADTYTILEKLEKGEPKLPALGRFGGAFAREGRPAPRPAPWGPPGATMEGSMSLREKLGRVLRAARPDGRMREGAAGG